MAGAHKYSQQGKPDSLTLKSSPPSGPKSLSLNWRWKEGGSKQALSLMKLAIVSVGLDNSWLLLLYSGA